MKDKSKAIYDLTLEFIQAAAGNETTKAQIIFNKIIDAVISDHNGDAQHAFDTAVHSVQYPDADENLDLDSEARELTEQEIAIIECVADDTGVAFTPPALKAA